ncbi:hypothetical protein FGO68_gene4070 [Halteria grandinella]|uniref:Uncharacterized protein n=1 Tax=Halteria grandinella TaxID=5974 RepID=A0A8J8NWL5_HALGN|nr:hypothetical protein FGO68_gene4070 [Halteria grandinella]
MICIIISFYADFFAIQLEQIGYDMRVFQRNFIYCKSFRCACILIKDLKQSIFQFYKLELQILARLLSFVLHDCPLCFI